MQVILYGNAIFPLRARRVRNGFRSYIIIYSFPGHAFYSILIFLTPSGVEMWQKTMFYHNVLPWQFTVTELLHKVHQTIGCFSTYMSWGRIIIRHSCTLEDFDRIPYARSPPNSPQMSVTMSYTCVPKDSLIRYSNWLEMWHFNFVLDVTLPWRQFNITPTHVT